MQNEDLHTIFSRFGTVISAEVIRDYKTGDSLCYAFIEFETNEACEQAYFKMDNALIDDRRIHVDFSQSVSKLWSQYRRRDSQMAKGKGCFKCGAPDHIAKDCTGDPSTKQQPPKYTLKEDNNQRGGDDNSRYEMVERRSSEDLEQREYENSRDRQRHSDRSREYRDHERNRESRTSQSSGSQRDYKYHEERRDREKYTEKRGHKDDSRRDDREYKKRNEDEREYRKRSVDNDSRGSGRDDEGHKRLNVDNHRRDKRDELNRPGDRDRDRHRRH
ncbi:Peptidyl-prolyl cis-trans isomerase CYP59 [Camellia lanceoleosa]|uniref:Peptidyl-prolyl cis-trans isomerase CYP59 n=1 Tax=Camellia lanceoleosa TaxID=1840588 RepID=A0ACC0HIA1_9ERIC|nr:Peptidyl-prolyl cis-trans isomerase CYP59 [Camellia lanceoleosa]